MRRSEQSTEFVVSGLGVVASIGQGREAFTEALLRGDHRFGLMRRPGRQCPGPNGADGQVPTSAFIGAEIGDLSMPASVPQSVLRTASLSAQAAVIALDEAWQDAALDEVDPRRIGLIVGGSNFQQRELVRFHDTYRGRESFLRPTYGMSFMDSDVCGLCTEIFNIRGFAHTLGGASASGQAAVIQAIYAVASGQVDACIAIGALMDLSYWECQGLRSIGAMGSDRYSADPAAACRPFDRDRDGFIFGESCGAVIVERADRVSRSGVRPYAALAGWATAMDGNRNPNPSVDGEVRAIEAALERAGVVAAEIDYVNPHGTGSTIGDTTELDALRRCGLEHVRLNATKSVIGHGLAAAGAVELIAVMLQMREGMLHPTRNLDHPIAPELNWVGAQAVPHVMRHALNLSMGFGGVNTAICLRAC
jgi:malonyl-ACP decarboxylase